MKTMISLIQPFVVKQTILVYNDKEKIDTILTSLDDFAETVYQIADEYDCSQLKFIGTTKFARGIGKKIEDLGLTKYTNQKIEILYS